MSDTETTYVIEAPGLNEALESMRRGGHVHLYDQDDAANRMCSAMRPCEGHDRIYLEEPSCPCLPNHARAGLSEARKIMAKREAAA